MASGNTTGDVSATEASWGKVVGQEGAAISSGKLLVKTQSLDVGYEADTETLTR